MLRRKNQVLGGGDCDLATCLYVELKGVSVVGMREVGKMGMAKVAVSPTALRYGGRSDKDVE